MSIGHSQGKKMAPKNAKVGSVLDILLIRKDSRGLDLQTKVCSFFILTGACANSWHVHQALSFPLAFSPSICSLFILSCFILLPLTPNHDDPQSSMPWLQQVVQSPRPFPTRQQIPGNALSGHVPWISCLACVLLNSTLSNTPAAKPKPCIAGFKRASA